MFNNILKDIKNKNIEKNEFCNNIYIKDNLLDKEKFENILNSAKEIIDECHFKVYKDHPIFIFLN